MNPGAPQPLKSRDGHDETHKLRNRIRELEETLDAIRSGSVDALVRDQGGVLTLSGADDLYRFTVETMLEGALTLAPNGRVLYCNRRFADLAGRAPEQIIGNPLQILIAQDGQNQLTQMLGSAQDSTRRGQLSLLRPDGEVVSVMVSLRDLSDTGTNALLGVATDVTELLQAREKQSQLARLVDTARDAIIAQDMNGVVTAWNRGAERLYGYSAEEMIGRHIDTIVPADRKGEVDELIAKVNAGQTVENHTTRRVAKSGENVDVQLTLSPIRDDSGCITGVSAIAHDIRGRIAAEQRLQASEHKFRQLFETASDAILIVDGIHETIIDANQRASEALEYERTQLLGKSLADLGLFSSPNDATRIMSQLRREGHVRLLDLTLLTRSGRRLDVEFVADRYNLEGTEVYQCNLRDISDRRRAELALRESERRFHSMLDNVQLIALMLDTSGNITYCNDYFLRLVGCARLDVIGQNWFQFFIPDDQREDARATLDALLHRKRQAWHHENEIITRSGERRLIRWNNTLLRGPDGRNAGSASLGADITDFRRASEQLKASEQRFHRLIDNISDTIAIAKLEGSIEFLSPAIHSITGHRPDELTDTSYMDLVHPDDQEAARSTLAALASDPEALQRGELRLRHKEGFWVPIEFTAANHTDTPGIEGLAITLRDITWRKEAEANLRLANLLIEQSPTVLFRWAAEDDWPVVYVSENVSQWGYDPAEILAGKRPFIEMIHPDDRQRVHEEVQAHVSDATSSFAQEYRILAPSGAVFWVDDRTTIERDDDGHPVHFQGVVMDITEQKQLEIERHRRLERVERQLDGLSRITRSQALLSGDVDSFARELTELSTQVTGAARASVWMFNDYESEMRCVDLYDAAAASHSAGAIVREHGHRREFSALKKSRYIAADDARQDPRTAGHTQHYLEPAGIASMLSAVAQVSTKNLGVISIEHVGPVRQWETDEISFACQLADQLGLTIMASQRKLDATNLLHLNRALTTLSAGNAAVVHAQSEEDLLKLMCDIVVDSGGYRMAWVAFAPAAGDDSVTPVAWAGDGSKFIKTKTIRCGESDTNPVAQAIRERQTQPITPDSDDPVFKAWRQPHNRVRSGLALPLYTTDQTLGVLCIYAAEADAFSDAEIALLEEMAGDLAYGIAARRTQIAHDLGLERLARSLDATVESLASVVELRDPYTAGHQRRVADIATAIGTAMELPDDRIKGLRLAAGIHDIGKISTPAEILAKPTRLTAIEYELVKGHAEAGYQLLQGVDFPWPVAEIIRQHHERIDGSGYPRKLTGDQIILEARILAVADVVEAIGSHRPYRAAKGIDAALEEILRGRGKLFDADVVDTCVRLFREQGFALPGS